MDSWSGNVNIERNKLGKIHAICLLRKRDTGPQIKVEMPVVNQEIVDHSFLSGDQMAKLAPESSSGRLRMLTELSEER
jgi:hypothetical protein